MLTYDLRRLETAYLEQNRWKMDGDDISLGHRRGLWSVTWMRADGVRLDTIAGMLGNAGVPTAGIHTRSSTGAPRIQHAS